MSIEAKYEVSLAQVALGIKAMQEYMNSGRKTWTADDRRRLERLYMEVDHSLIRAETLKEVLEENIK